MRRIVSAVVVATAIAAVGAPAASAQSGDPLGGLLGGAGGLLGTGTSCQSGLISVVLGGTAVCVAPTSEPAPSATSCPDGVAAVNLAGQGVACVAPGQETTGGAPCPPSVLTVVLPGGDGLACVLPGDVQVIGTGECPTGTLPVQVLGADVVCLVQSVLGLDGANGTPGGPGTPGTPGGNGTNGANGANGAGGAGGSGSGANGSGGLSQAGAGSTSAGRVGARLLKPKLRNRKRARGGRVVRGQIRASTRRVVVKTRGMRKGKMVRTLDRYTLKRKGGGARPFRKTVRIKTRATSAVKVRVISRAEGRKKAATFRVKKARR